MMNIQDFIIEATKGISVEILRRNNFTISHVGRVEKIDSSNRKTVVDIDGMKINCILPVNMLRYVAVGDIVVVQDLHNNKSYMIIHGVIRGSGGNGGNAVIHIYDDATNTVVSSVLQVWNQATNSVVSTTFKIEGSGM